MSMRCSAAREAAAACAIVWQISKQPGGAVDFLVRVAQATADAWRRERAIGRERASKCGERERTDVGSSSAREDASSFVEMRRRDRSAISGSTCGSRFVSRSSSERGCAIGIEQHAADFHADALGADAW